MLDDTEILRVVVTTQDAVEERRPTVGRLREMLRSTRPKAFVVLEHLPFADKCFAQACWEPGAELYNVEYRDQTGLYQTTMDAEQTLRFLRAWAQEHPYFNAAPRPWKRVPTANEVH